MLDVKTLFAADAAALAARLSLVLKHQSGCENQLQQPAAVAVTSSVSLWLSYMPTISVGRSSRAAADMAPDAPLPCGSPAWQPRVPSGPAVALVATAASPHSWPTQLPEALSGQAAQGSDQHSTPECCLGAGC